MNPGQPPSPTFDVPQSDPLELHGVDRDSNGRLRVCARYHGKIQLVNPFLSYEKLKLKPRWARFILAVRVSLRRVVSMSLVVP